MLKEREILNCLIWMCFTTLKYIVGTKTQSHLVESIEKNSSVFIRYPFDTQRCRIHISLLGDSDEFINLLPGLLSYLGPEDLTIYFIKKTAIHTGQSNSNVIVYVEVTLGRRLLSTVLTVYLPTILLNVIGFSTNFFKVCISNSHKI